MILHKKNHQHHELFFLHATLIYICCATTLDGSAQGILGSYFHLTEGRKISISLGLTVILLSSDVIEYDVEGIRRASNDQINIIPLPPVSMTPVVDGSEILIPLPPVRREYPLLLMIAMRLANSLWHVKGREMELHGESLGRRQPPSSSAYHS